MLLHKAVTSLFNKQESERHSFTAKFRLGANEIFRLRWLFKWRFRNIPSQRSNEKLQSSEKS